MSTGMVLFGFDLFAIVVSLCKLTFTELAPGANEKVKRVVLAAMVAAVVVVVGCQAQGLFFPPESEPVVNLVLSAIMAFLVVMGYGTEAIGTVQAVVDLIRLSAVHLWLGAVDSEERMDKTVSLLVKYRIK